MDRDRTGGPTSVGLYVNETRVASLRGVGDRYFSWAAARGVDALVPPFSDEETHDFCSLDCLSRWVEAQQLIAVAEERP